MAVEKLFSNIVGTAVVDDDGHLITTVRDVVIDPESGKLIALVVDISRNLVIAPMDILSFGDVVRVPAHDAVVDGKEILRVAEVQKRHTYIFHNRVEAKNGEYIGNVIDFSIDSRDLHLKKIYTAKSLIGFFRYDQRIIPAKLIEKILHDKIIVKENMNTVREKQAVAMEDLAVG